MSPVLVRAVTPDGMLQMAVPTDLEPLARAQERDAAQPKGTRR